MAPALAEARAAAGLTKRFYYYCDPNVQNCSWYFWGRWVLLGILLIFALLVLALLSRRASRRRRAGVPMFANGAWRTGGGHQHQQWPGQQQPQYAGGQAQYPGQSNQQPAQPVYDQQQQGTYAPPPKYAKEAYPGPATAGASAGVMSPAPAYTSPRANEQDYAPPTGPPPGKA